MFILDGASGAVLSTLPFDPVVITNGTFVVNMAGVTADGVIFLCNLTVDAAVATTPFKLYRWASETAQPQLGYSGDPLANSSVGTSPVDMATLSPDSRSKASQARAQPWS